MVEMKVLLPVAIATLALLVSIVSLYVSKLRPGKLKLTAGEHVAISHQPEGPVNFILPVNFSNAGSNYLTVDRVALLFQQRGNPEGYLLEPAFYLTLAESGSFTYESLSVPITIFGGENVTKQIMFNSSAERPAEFQMTKAGTYDLFLLAWIHGSPQPCVSDDFSIVVSEAHAATLVKYIGEKSLNSVKLPQSKWRSWDAHYCKAIEVDNIKKS